MSSLKQANDGDRKSRSVGTTLAGQGGAAGLVALAGYMAINSYGFEAEAVALAAPILMSVLTVGGKVLRNVGNEFGLARFFA